MAQVNESTLLNGSAYFGDNETDVEMFEAIGQPASLILFTIVWTLIAIVGILANSCVIAVMFFSAKLTSATQYFIINLAISDILFLAICPTLVLINVHKLVSYEEMPDLLAKLLCKADYFSSHVSLHIFLKASLKLISNKFISIFFIAHCFYYMFDSYVYDVWLVDIIFD
jgi:hypothetical protein